MLAAASAWNALAAELRATALSYRSVLSELSEQWHGPTSAAMAAAAMPYVLWMSTTAVQAEQTAAQAEAAVAAYEAAFSATVPPPVIAANRARLMLLIATNILGQNTPAIAATEAEYAELWAQDAGAMYGYAASSAVASELTPFTQPQQTTSLGGLAAQPAAVDQATATPAGTGQSTLSEVISAVPGVLHGLASPAATGSSLGGVLDDLGLDIFSPTSGTSTSGLSGLLNVISGANGSAFGEFLNANFVNSIFASGFYMPKNFAGTASSFMGLSGQAAGDTAAAAEWAAGAVPGPLGSVGALGNSVAASMGEGALVGPLSVPAGWATTAPAHSPLAAGLGTAPMAAPGPAEAASTPPVPLGATMGVQGEGRAVPQYGFRPTFVARPPAAG
jgi:PPE-repeat protein